MGKNGQHELPQKPEVIAIMLKTNGKTLHFKLSMQP